MRILSGLMVPFPMEDKKRRYGMRRVTIALVDDDETFLHVASGHAQACLDRLGRKGETSLFTEPDLFRETFGKRCFDIVFLDIFFPGHNGMALAKEIRARDEKCLIVFLTVTDDYAVQGYGVNAFDYLVKPLRPEALEKTLANCLKRIEETTARFLTLKHGNELRRVGVDEVVYFEIKNRHVHVHGERGEMFARFGRLEDVAPVLPPEFVRIHQSFVANIARALNMKNYRLHMDTGAVLPVSRPYRKTAADAFFGAVKREL